MLGIEIQREKFLLLAAALALAVVKLYNACLEKIFTLVIDNTCSRQ